MNRILANPLSNNNTMKTKPLRDTVFTLPFKKWGGWHYISFPPIGEEKVHGPFATRESARDDRKTNKEESAGDRHSYEWALANR
jgi:hypothetical protein